jgi:hypothetical protein
MDWHRHGDGADTEITATEGHTFDDLLDAIEWVESKGDANAIGDGGDAVGAYQIHKIYVDDVNRILRILLRGNKGIRLATYEHRSDKELSRYMTSLYIQFYGAMAVGDIDYNSVKFMEAAARIHNGGPKGHLKKSTEAYWAKVKARMERK